MLDPCCSPGGAAVRLAIAAMATRFELVLPIGQPGLGEASLRAAGEAALAEVTEVEDWLSVYRPQSQIARVNSGAARAPVRVLLPVFALLVAARDWSQRTGNAFDPTVGPLVRFWREADPAAGDWTSRMSTARGLVGWRDVELAAGTVRFHRPGVQLDLGSIGKGWALDRALEVLREAGVTSALLHGGTSTVAALGSPPDAAEWWIEIADAPDAPASPPTERLRVPLWDAALSVSATWGRTHRDPQGRLRGHILDPRTGEPVEGPRRAAVVGPSGLITDVLSTALLVAGATFLSELPSLGVGLRGWYHGLPG